MSSKYLIYLLFAALLLQTADAFAHRIRVFAYENGGVIFTEAKFSGGKPVKGANVVVENDSTHDVLLRGITDQKGTFNFQAPEKARAKHADLNIIISAGEGHKSHWLLKAEDYLGSHTHSDNQSPVEETPQDEESPTTKNDPPLTEAQVQKIVEGVVDARLAPLKRMLAQSLNQGPTLQDILGGLGYILGLTGIVAYFRSQKREKEHDVNSLSQENSSHDG